MSGNVQWVESVDVVRGPVALSLTHAGSILIEERVDYERGVDGRRMEHESFYRHRRSA